MPGATCYIKLKLCFVHCCVIPDGLHFKIMMFEILI